MATYSAIENNVIEVDLLTAANDTGWSLLPGGIAKHVKCNNGYITLLNYPIVAGHTYNVTYTILTISGGSLRCELGGSSGDSSTSPDIIIETITAINTNPLKLFSNANCTVQLFNVQDITVNDPVTIVWSEINKKWSDTRTLYPAFGFSLLDTNGLMYHGNLYIQQNGSDSRNNFFGTQYQSSIRFVEAKNPEIVNDYEALNYQANMLLVTTINGASTPNGQVSTLIPTDFIKQNLMYAGLQVIQYEKDNVYFASFLPDSNDDAVNGAQLRGNYIMIELITVDGSTPLQLFSVGVKTRRIYLGAR